MNGSKRLILLRSRVTGSADPPDADTRWIPEGVPNRMELSGPQENPTGAAVCAGPSNDRLWLTAADGNFR